MRKTPVYAHQGPVNTWLEQNGGIMYTEVLEAIESALNEEPITIPIPVIILQENSGSTLFVLKTDQTILEGIEKALNWFVSVEEYEKAARARDAKIAYQKRSDA